MKGGEIADKTWDVVKTAVKTQFETEEVFVSLNSFLNLVDGVFNWLCVGIFGNIWGLIAHLFLTVDLAYGISITALSLNLLVVWDLLGTKDEATETKDFSDERN